MNKHFLYEAYETPKFPLIFGSNINDEIESICEYNKGNETAVLRLKETIVWISNYFSQWKIALDYGGSFIHNSNGVTVVSEKCYGFYLEYMLSTNEETEEQFVEIIQLKLDYEGMGLEIPSWLQLGENKQSRLDNIITEVLNDFLSREMLIA